MKKIQTLFFYILIISIACSCSTNLTSEKLKERDQKEDKELTEKLPVVSIPEKFLTNESSNNYLKTGWYSIFEDKTKGIPKEININGNIEIIYIDTIPQLSVQDIEFFYLTKEARLENVLNLIMYFDTKGTEKWAILTEQSIHKRLAFVINNVVVTTPTVHSQIPNGVSLMSGNEFTPAEMLAIKRLLESQKQMIKKNNNK